MRDTKVQRGDGFEVKPLLGLVRFGGIFSFFWLYEMEGSLFQGFCGFFFQLDNINIIKIYQNTMGSKLNYLL